MIHYILQIVVFQCLFLLVYDLFLKKETFFTANRLYLLITPVISLVLPLIKIEAIRQQIPQEFMVNLPAVIIGETAKNEVVNTESSLINFFNLISAVWIAGSLFTAIYFGRKIHQLKKLKQNAIILKLNGVTYYQLPKTDAAFTFWKSIFMGENLSEKQRENILLHEQIHVKELHAADLLFFEILKMLLWFNPLVYVFQNRLKTLHEFTADRKIAEQKGKKNYYNSLLEQVFQTEDFAFTNTFFNHSIIKKRISMLQKSKSKQIFQLKYALLIPIVLGILTYTSCSQDKEVNKEASLSNQIEALQIAIEEKGELTEVELEQLNELNARSAMVNAGVKGNENLHFDLPPKNFKTSGVPFGAIDKAPVFPGCEGLPEEEAKHCFTQKIAQFVIDNFDTKVGKGSDVVGKQRIFVQFVINPGGNVENIKARAASVQLQDEAIKVIKKLPKMEPGEHDGKKVAVQYALPILFEF